MPDMLGGEASSNGARIGHEERSDPSRRDAYKVIRPISTRWMDNDIYAHVNNVVYYSFFDTAVSGWLVEQGLLDPIESEQICLVVETGCRYFAPLSFPDHVSVGLRTAHIGRSSVRYELGIFRNEDNVASAEGFFVHVHVNRQTRRPEPMTPTLRAALEAIASNV